MLILGIESSCDETATALVEDGSKVHASLVISQIDKHLIFGGVIPEIAAREHLKVIDRMTRTVMAEMGVTIDQVDAIAVTQGPGLIGALLVGISYAKGLALSSGKPLIPVDHVHAHAMGALLGVERNANTVYPCLAAVVSGGHTNLYYVKEPTDFELMAHTIDDACGESFDKVAKLFQLGYPGGPIIEQRARDGNPSAYAMPVMIEQKSRLAFSYSGLKTFVVNLKRKLGDTLTDQQINDICASFQDAALLQLIRKIDAALRLRPDCRSVLIAGGVAANQRFRQLMAEKISVEAIFPALKYCADNAAMIASLGYYMYRKEEPGKASFFAAEGWDAYSRYRFPGV